VQLPKTLLGKQGKCPGCRASVTVTPAEIQAPAQPPPLQSQPAEAPSNNPTPQIAADESPATGIGAVNVQPQNSPDPNNISLKWKASVTLGQDEKTFEVSKDGLPLLACRCHGCDKITLLMSSKCLHCGGFLLYTKADAAEGSKLWSCFHCKKGFSESTCECGVTNSHLNMKFFNAKGEGSCFVATVCFGDLHHPVVEELRVFRDEFLKTTRLGRGFVKCYYCVGPWLASMIRKLPFLHPPIRSLLRCVLRVSSLLHLHKQ
jgi:hypothetical protein